MRGTTDREITLETLMGEIGRKRFWSRVHSAKKYDRQTDTTAGRYLLREGARKLTAEVKSWVKNAQARPGVGHNLAPLLAQFKPGIVAFLAVRSVLDSLGRENSLLSAGYAIGGMLEEEARFMAINRADSRVWRDLRKRIRHARNDRQKMALIRDVVLKLECAIEPWSKKDKMKVGMILLDLMRMHTGLIRIQTLTFANGRRRNMIVPTDETLAWLEKSHASHESMFPFWMPSVVPPLDWDNPYDGGYHTNLIQRRPLIKTRDRNFLRELDNADMGEVYDAVNILQHTEWEINPFVYATMKSFWDRGLPVAGLPDREDEPIILRPENVDDDPETLKAYKKSLAQRYGRLVSARSNRVLAAKIMFMADHFQSEGKFYYPYQVDFRGRVYPVPYFLQPQGPSHARGLLRFHEGKVIDSLAAETWLAVHGANTFGVDKVSIDERVEWVRKNERLIADIASDPLSNQQWASADKPWEFLAWCQEWAGYVAAKAGRLPFVSKLPIAMDGSNNGLQIFSLLLRDEAGAIATNCVPSDRPQDIYQDVADLVTNRLIASTDPMAAKWLEFVGGRLPRAATKRSVMTLPYGSTYHACIHYTRDWYQEVVKSRGGVTPFERGYKPSEFLARLIWDAISETVSSARSCMEWLRQVSDVFSKNGVPVRWTSPSGFPVKQGYFKYKTKQIKTVVGESVRFANYREDTDSVAKQKQKNGISPNFVHSLDAAALVKTVKRAHERGVHSFAVIHDSFGVLAADAPKMAGSLREVYAEMFSDDLLGRLNEEFKLYLPEGVELPPVPPMGDLDPTLVRESIYFFA